MQGVISLEQVGSTEVVLARCRASELMEQEFARVEEEHEALEPLMRGAEEEQVCTSPSAPHLLSLFQSFDAHHSPGARHMSL